MTSCMVKGFTAEAGSGTVGWGMACDIKLSLYRHCL